MKMALRILTTFLMIVLLLVAAAFVFIEGRLVFSGDWLLHEKSLIGFLQYFCRMLLAITAGVLAVLTIKKVIKK